MFCCVAGSGGGGGGGGNGKGGGGRGGRIALVVLILDVRNPLVAVGAVFTSEASFGGTEEAVSRSTFEIPVAVLGVLLDTTVLLRCFSIVKLFCFSD